MKRRITYLLLAALLFAVAPLHAQRVDGKALVDVEDRFGDKDEYIRVTSKVKSKLILHHGLTVTLSGTYFSGDIIQPVAALKYGELGNSLGVALTVNYKLTFNPYVSMRFGLQGGLLRGTNRHAVTAGEISYLHEFRSLFLEPFAGVEVYPILNRGFFLYGGFGLTGSLMNYEHTKNRAPVYKEENWLGIVPMVQLGLGYNWWLTQSFTLGVELMGQIGFFDGQRFGLDGWPVKGAFNLDPKDPANEMSAYSNAKMPDGWLQLGIVASYHF